jgi:pyridoxamine 5'-phosphate oxidase
MDLDRMRTDYRRAVLTAEELGDDPLASLARWIDEAADEGMHEPNAMALATAGADGRPSGRFVLCKGIDADGIVFYTNYQSRKGRDLDAMPWAAATFWWDRLERQVRLEGPTERLPEATSDAYFASRPYGSRIGAWASPQGFELEDRAALERRFATARERFPEGAPIPRPPFWCGYRIRPVRIEFWQGRENRAHDRIEFRRAVDGDAPAGAWRTARLAP